MPSAAIATATFAAGLPGRIAQVLAGTFPHQDMSDLYDGSVMTKHIVWRWREARDGI